VTDAVIDHAAGDRDAARMSWKRKAAHSEPSYPSWPFDQGPDVAAMTARRVLEGDPVLFVAHDADDHGWQFLDGREPMVEEARVVRMANMLARDPSLRDIADLPPGTDDLESDAPRGKLGMEVVQQFRTRKVDERR